MGVCEWLGGGGFGLGVGGLALGGEGGRAGGERLQEFGEWVSCVARQTLLVDERECGIHDLLAGVPTGDVFGEFSEPAELVGEAFGGDLAPRCRVRMCELSRDHPRPLQRRSEVHEAGLGTGARRRQVAQFGLLDQRARRPDLRREGGPPLIAGAVAKRRYPALSAPSPPHSIWLSVKTPLGGRGGRQETAIGRILIPADVPLEHVGRVVSEVM